MNETNHTMPKSGNILLVGHGSHDHLTHRARAAIAEADTVIGYAPISAWSRNCLTARKSSKRR
jgi:precorrin-3B C17-methyltransferase